MFVTAEGRVILGGFLERHTPFTLPSDPEERPGWSISWSTDPAIEDYVVPNDVDPELYFSAMGNSGYGFKDELPEEQHADVRAFLYSTDMAGDLFSFGFLIISVCSIGLCLETS